jgi:hypothetical protein
MESWIKTDNFIKRLMKQQMNNHFLDQQHMLDKYTIILSIPNIVLTPHPLNYFVDTGLYGKILEEYLQEHNIEYTCGYKFDDWLSWTKNSAIVYTFTINGKEYSAGRFGMCGTENNIDQHPDFENMCLLPARDRAAREAMNDFDSWFISLDKHNIQRFCLGLKTVETLPEIDELQRVFKLWKYRPGGDVYLACKKIVEPV